jgi:uncharacterized membrane protein YhhN
VGVPGFAGICCLYSLINHDKNNKSKYYITIALFFAMVAEIINACNLDFGLLFFAVTHICLTIYHWKRSKKFTKFHFWTLILFILLYALIVGLLEFFLFHNYEIYPTSNGSNKPSIEYVIVIPAYMFILSLMA